MHEKNVETVMKKNGLIIDPSVYGAEFFGYDCQFGEITPKMFKSNYGIVNNYIGTNTNDHLLTVSFILNEFEKGLEFVRLLDNVSFGFTDTILKYEAIHSNYEYETIANDCYLFTITFSAIAWGNELKHKLADIKNNLKIESPLPTFVYINIKAKVNVNDYIIHLKYFDSFYLKRVDNILRIKKMNAGSEIFIDSRKFRIYVDNRINVNEVEIDIFPILNGEMSLELPNSNVEVKITYVRRY